MALFKKKSPMKNISLIIKTKGKKKEKEKRKTLDIKRKILKIYTSVKKTIKKKSFINGLPYLLKLFYL